MRYCPVCRIDYDDEVEDCVECGGPLVEGTSRELYEEIPEEAWVELDPLGSLAHAKSVMDALDEEQISCYIEASYSSTTIDGFAGTIIVTEADFDIALEIQQGMALPDDDDLLIDPDADDF